MDVKKHKYLTKERWPIWARFDPISTKHFDTFKCLWIAEGNGIVRSLDQCETEIGINMNTEYGDLLSSALVNCEQMS